FREGLHGVERRTHSGTRSPRDRALSGLGGQRTGVRHAALDPLGELTLLANVLCVHPEPAVHRPPAHDHRVCLRRGNELLRRRRVDPHEDPALTARSDGHVAPDQEGQPAEHLLLREALLPGHEAADPVCEILVVRHGYGPLPTPVDVVRNTKTEPTAPSTTPATASPRPRTSHRVARRVPITPSTTAEAPATNARYPRAAKRIERTPNTSDATQAALVGSPGLRSTL